MIDPLALAHEIALFYKAWAAVNQLTLQVLADPELPAEVLLEFDSGNTSFSPRSHFNFGI